MSKRQTRVYDLLDALVEEVGAMQGEAYLRGNFDDASWLACAEDALQRFADTFDDAVDVEAERRYDRMTERSGEEDVSGAMELAMQAESARRLK